MDRIDPATRSRNMARIRSRGNYTTEKRLRAYLMRSRISGWELHCTDLAGSPDFVFTGRRLVVFVDGCFWHGCPKCGHVPRSNTKYWSNKLERNQDRDKRITAELRASGWTVLRLWEHEIKSSPDQAIRRIKLHTKQLSSKRHRTRQI